jgi:WD40 repeat protein
MLMTATSDGAVRLFAPGSRRAAAMIRGPKDGLTSAVAIGTEAFIASAGRDPHVARHDLATGRELGVLLTTVDGVSPELTCIKGGGAHGGPVVVAAGEGGDVFLWDVRLAPRGGHRSSLGGGAAVPAMTLHVAGAARIHAMSLSNATGGGAHGTAPASLALVASNGGRVFDLRAPGRPARLAALETGQRWVTCAHAGASDDVLTLSAQGDLQAWRSNGGFNYSAHRGVLREVGSTFGGANNRGACVLSASRGETDVMCVTTAGERGDGFRVSDVSTGDVVAEWGGDGERADVGCGGGGGLGAGWARRVDEEVSAVTAAGWGVGCLGDAFGGASFAVGTSDGVVRVYGPGA